MSSDPTTEALKQAWLAQPAPPPGISLEDVKRASRKFQRNIGIRNFIEYAAALFVVLGYSQMLFKSEKPLFQVGCVLIVMATMYVVVQVHVRMSSQQPPADALAATFIDFHRVAVLRQIAGLESVLFWYLLPFAPGWSLFIVQALLDRAWGGLTFLVVAALVVGFGIVTLNKWGAARLRRKLEELDAVGVRDASNQEAA